MSKEIEKLSEKIDILSTNIGRIDDGVKSLHGRVKAIEDKQTHGKGDNVEPHAQVGQPVPNEVDQEGAVGGSVQNPLTNLTDYTNIQQEFTVIKDSLQRVRLSNELKVNDSSVGIQRADQPRHKVVSKCARYAETLIKLLSSLNAETVSQGDIQDLLTICIAQVRYLQEEQSMMLVNSSFGGNVERLYRTLRNNSAQFSPESLETLQAAVVLGGHAQNNPGNQRGQNYRGQGQNQGYRTPRPNPGGWRPGQGRTNRIPPTRNQDQAGQGNQGADNQ